MADSEPEAVAPPPDGGRGHHFRLLFGGEDPARFILPVGTDMAALGTGGMVMDLRGCLPGFDPTVVLKEPRPERPVEFCESKVAYHCDNGP
jgi:hypothetical protein